MMASFVLLLLLFGKLLAAADTTLSPRPFDRMALRAVIDLLLAMLCW